MKRREFLRGTALTLGMAGVAGALPAGDPSMAGHLAGGGPLRAPEGRKINVAFLIAEGANVIDLAGAWEVFQDVHVPGRGESMDEIMPFRLYTVAATRDPITATGGLRIVPNYTFDDAPAPDLISVGAQRGSEAGWAWLAATAPQTQLTMSVCTGAFQLGGAGLLDGLTATTHHDFYDDFAARFPKVAVERGLRFVEHDRIATAGGLTSGIDLALRTVERYFGRDVAQATADYMEYQSIGWHV